MKKNEQISSLAYEIIVDISEEKLQLSSIFLKASRLSLLLDIPFNTQLFQTWASDADLSSFAINSFNSSMLAS